MLIGKLRKLVKKSYLPEKPLKRYNKNEFNNDVVVITDSGMVTAVRLLQL